MEKTIAKNIALSQLIAKMREIRNEFGASGSFAYSDMLHDIEQIAAMQEQTDKDSSASLYWGIRENGTQTYNYALELAEWAAHLQTGCGETPKCFRIWLYEGCFSIYALD